MKIKCLLSVILILSDNFFATHLTFVLVFIAFGILSRLFVLLLAAHFVLHVVHIDDKLSFFILCPCLLFTLRRRLDFLGQQLLSLLRLLFCLKGLKVDLTTALVAIIVTLISFPRSGRIANLSLFSATCT